MHNSLQEKLDYEIEQVDKLLESFAPLLSKTREKKPDFIELSALATLLHSFYGGIENIFVTIGKNIDNKVPSGYKWHKDLLTQMEEKTFHRKAVITSEQFTELLEYLSFRHFFRNSYAYQFDWEQMKPLVLELNKTWDKLKRYLVQFTINGQDK